MKQMKAFQGGLRFGFLTGITFFVMGLVAAPVHAMTTTAMSPPPVDTDGDGILDIDDECPLLPTTNTITGTAGNDTLSGTPANDLIRGLGGNDILRGYGGDDCLVGGPGHDKIKGYAGEDMLLGQDGDDKLQGGDGADTMDGGEGADKMSGDAGSDVMAGDAGDDRLSGGSGDDALDGGSNTDRCSGGSGTDTAINCEMTRSATTITITLPAAPTGVSATADYGNGAVTIQWNRVAGATYNLYMASISGVTPLNYSTLPEGMQHVGVFSPYTHTGLTNGTTYYFIVTAVNSAGESDGSMEVSATPSHPPLNHARGFNGYVYTLMPASDGSGDIYAGGVFTSYNGMGANKIIRLNADGTVDSDFAIGTGFNSSVRTLMPASDGSGDIYAGGVFTSYNGMRANKVIRLNADGTVDSGFAIGTGFDYDVFTLMLASDGSGDIYAGGVFTSYNGTGARKIIRLNADGTVDSGFVIHAGFSGGVYTLMPASDGSGDIYAGGSFISYNGTWATCIIRLNADGTVDSSFAMRPGFDYDVFTLMPASDGSGDIYVGGFFTSYNGTGANKIIRLNADGTVDSGFAIGTGFNSSVRTLMPASDGSGDIYAGGYFTSYNGTGANFIIRLNADGTVDSGFSIGIGFNGYVSTLMPASDGSGDIYVGGWFTYYNNVLVDYIARLGPDGTVY